MTEADSSKVTGFPEGTASSSQYWACTNRLSNRRIVFRFPMKFSSSPKRPDRLWFPPSVLFHGYWDLIPLRKAPGAYRHRTEIKIRGAMPTIHMISRCVQENLQLHFTSSHFTTKSANYSRTDTTF